jgi:hypothetical protein
VDSGADPQGSAVGMLVTAQTIGVTITFADPCARASFRGSEQLVLIARSCRETPSAKCRYS